jgi:hypothetical protein
VVAGSLLACALASLPYAGSFGPAYDAVRTVGGRPSTALPAAGADAPAVEELAAPALAATGAVAVPVVAPPPPSDEPPPPPAPPPGVDPHPSVGVVYGTGPGADVPVEAPPVDDPRLPNRDAERVWAVVIGIDDYPGTRSDLRAARADAADLVAALVRFGVPGNQIRPMYDRAATIDEVLEAVDWLVENAGPDDTAVFLYAGHVRDLGGGTEAVVTADAGWITDWFLADRFAGLASRDAWFVLATCYGGGFDELLAPGRVLTAAAGPGQLAYENDVYQRSYLAEFVLRRGLLEGAAGDPTVQAAVAYGSQMLAEHHPERQLWNADLAGHVISLDGVRRDAPVEEAPPPPPPPASPVGGDVVAGTACFLGLCPG